MILIDLENLKSIVPDLTESWATSRLEAAVFCLDYNGHRSRIKMNVSPNNNSFVIHWKMSMDQRVKNTWNDVQEATEKGAEGIAAILVNELTQYKVIRRSVKKTGIDYWLGYKENETLLFQDAARLEISGLIDGTNGEFNRRVKDKSEQVKQSNATRLPAYISITDFGEPRTMFKKL